VLSRNIAQSNVVIVSPNFKDARVYNENEKDTVTIDGVYHPAKVAMDQGHTTHLFPSSIDFANGWIDSSSGQKYNSSSVGWILLAYFSTQSLSNDASPTIDEILSPFNEAVKSWLTSTTITYIVFPIKASAKVLLSSIRVEQEHAYEMDYTVDKIVELTGLDAAQTLLRSNYKLQLLASSHYFDAETNSDDEHYYGPNALFQNKKQLDRFLYQRVTEVLKTEVRHLR
jgi:hypothetical protein